MKNFIFLLITFLFVVGCADKKYIHEPLKNELLAYTSKEEIIKDDRRVLSIATYLNPVVKVQENERFILAIYPKQTPIKADSFRLNGKSDGLIVNILKDDDEILKNTSFEMPWGAYYEVLSPTVVSDTLDLSFEIYQLGTVSLKFRKVAKSMYWSSGAVNK